MWLPRCYSGQESTCQGRRCKRCKFDLWVWKIPWGDNGNLFQYSCLENPMARRGIMGYGLWGHKEPDTTKQLSTHTYIHIYVYTYITDNYIIIIQYIVHIYIHIQIDWRRDAYYLIYLFQWIYLSLTFLTYLLIHMFNVCLLPLWCMLLEARNCVLFTAWPVVSVRGPAIGHSVNICWWMKTYIHTK